MWNYNFYVYITTNRDKSVLYVGVTNDLTRRLDEHRHNTDAKSSFTGKYHCYYLVYYEHYTHIEHAIEREKQIKKWRREKKDALIASTNPEWRFLNKEINDD
ncbi:GIY-YIG nuclease family protein [Mucilaginibacter psychrotolerans]|uniref:GIY-YIG nuclease family protein n=1 Tax=Mucilaginibacter psychrotolerans TaxID=1524096 RepID=A0A4Y8S9N6_9SPHI|nr:GIY-YIG nuclease family protein [Mucilaginibacter psychrotolerans]TFF35739.1 GIY-YIG nuclease family protein [Mucilaginibacter psychrotolerans]